MIKSFKGNPIRQRESDGYICATDIFKIFYIRFYHYRTNASTSAYLKSLSKELNLSILGREQLIDIRKGGKDQGIYVHPKVATHLAMWISPDFAVEVSSWVEQWN